MEGQGASPEEVLLGGTPLCSARSLSLSWSLLTHRRASAKVLAHSTLLAHWALTEVKAVWPRSRCVTPNELLLLSGLGFPTFRAD